MAPEIYEENIPSDCKMCGLNDFEENEKGFYCVECGTKVSNLNTDRQANETIEEYQDDSEASLISMTMKWNFPPCISQVNTPKIVHVKQRKIQPLIRLNHSVSYYSYILHDMAEKLVALGAKKEFKLMVLQIWAAYLESKKIVFHKKRPFANTNGDTANGLKSRKRDSAGLVDQVNATTSLSEDGLSSSGTTQHVIQYNKRLKQSGGTQALTSNGHTKSKEENAGGVDILRLYAVLAIALNLAQDDLQLSDLVRFIADGHMRPHNTVAKFPDDVVKKLTKDSRFNLKPSYKLLHEEVQEVAKIIDVETFEIPDMCKLASRYVSELNLPQEIALCVERLINVLPPEMKMRTNNGYPAYEARAMAYIAFVLKLLFGLDGEKEIRIGDSAKEINEVIEQVNNPNSRYPKLFVWSEWVEYVEMRKIIISQYNFNFSLQFKNSGSAEQYLQQIQQFSRELGLEDDWKVMSMQHILEKFLHAQKDQVPFSNKPIVFEHSLTPTKSYFEQILATFSIRGYSKDHIPLYMYKNHSERCIKPYLDPSLLSKFLSDKHVLLDIKPIKCKNGSSIGILNTPSNLLMPFKHKVKPDFNITKREWLKNVTAKADCDEFYIEEPSCSNNNDSRDSNLLASLLMSGNQPIRKNDNIINFMKTLPSQDTEHNPDGKRPNTEHDSVGNCSATNPRTANLKVSALDYWILIGFVSHFKNKHVKSLEKELPLSFRWLMEMCAQTIGLEWITVYEQLVVIEAMVFFGIKNLENFEDCFYLDLNTNIKELNLLLRKY